MSDDTVGYSATDADPFDVTLHPTADEAEDAGMITVSHPVGPTTAVEPTEDAADDFWDRDPDAIIKKAIRHYCLGLEGDWVVIGEIYQDAKDIGIDFDRGGS